MWGSAGCVVYGLDGMYVWNKEYCSLFGIISGIPHNIWYYIILGALARGLIILSGEHTLGGVFGG